MSEVTQEAPLVSIRGLSKAYVRGDQSIPVLVDINLDVQAGDYVALMGPSGSGKSTLLNLIAGIDKPTSGQILVAGVDIAQLTDAELAAWRATHVGFIFQFYNLMPVLTAFENVELPLQLRGDAPGEVRSRAEVALARAGLEDAGDRLAEELSGGQRQRVAVARALVAAPRLLVADEPTAELDADTAALVLSALREEAGAGAAVVIATHDPDVAALCDTTVHLVDGRREDA